MPTFLKQQLCVLKVHLETTRVGETREIPTVTRTGSTSLKGDWKLHKSSQVEILLKNRSFTISVAAYRSPFPEQGRKLSEVVEWDVLVAEKHRHQQGKHRSSERHSSGPLSPYLLFDSSPNQINFGIINKPETCCVRTLQPCVLLALEMLSENFPPENSRGRAHAGWSALLLPRLKTESPFIVSFFVIDHVCLITKTSMFHFWRVLHLDFLLSIVRHLPVHVEVQVGPTSAVTLLFSRPL